MLRSRVMRAQNWTRRYPRPTARLPGPAISPHGGAFLLLLPMLPVFIVVVVPCFVVQVREVACSCAAPSLAVLRSVAADAPQTAVHARSVDDHMIRRDHRSATNLRRFALRRPAPRGIAQPQKAPHRNLLSDGARRWWCGPIARTVARAHDGGKKSFSFTCP